MMYAILSFKEVISDYLQNLPICILNMFGKVHTEWMGYRELVFEREKGALFVRRLYSEDLDNTECLYVFFYRGYRIEVDEYSEGGYCYTFFNSGYEDGGVCDQMSITEILKAIISDIDANEERKFGISVRA